MSQASDELNQQRLRNILTANLPKPAKSKRQQTYTILCIGIGRGEEIAALVQHVGKSGKIIGIDYSADKIADCKKQYSDDDRHQLHVLDFTDYQKLEAIIKQSGPIDMIYLGHPVVNPFGRSANWPMDNQLMAYEKFIVTILPRIAIGIPVLATHYNHHEQTAFQRLAAQSLRQSEMQTIKSAKLNPRIVLEAYSHYVVIPNFSPKPEKSLISPEQYAKQQSSAMWQRRVCCVGVTAATFAAAGLTFFGPQLLGNPDDPGSGNSFTP